MSKELGMMIAGTLLFGGLIGVFGWEQRPRSLPQPVSSTATAEPPKIATVEAPRAVEKVPAAHAKLPLDETSYLASIARPDIYPVRDWSVPEPAGIISASSTLVMLADSEKILWEKSSHEQIPIASITKLLTALTALERARPETVMTVSQEAIAEEGNSGLLPNDRFTLAQLVLFMLLPSSNDAAKAVWLALGREDFTAALNEKARALGMKESHFTNASGLDGGEEYSTAYDVALLLKAVLRQDFLVKSMGLPSVTVTSQAGRNVTMHNSNKLLGKIPGLLLGKTGFTGQARQSLTVVTEEGEAKERVIFVILGSDDRFGDMEKLIAWTRKAYRF